MDIWLLLLIVVKSLFKTFALEGMDLVWNLLQTAAVEHTGPTLEPYIHISPRLLYCAIIYSSSLFGFKQCGTNEQNIAVPHSIWGCCSQRRNQFLKEQSGWKELHLVQGWRYCASLQERVQTPRRAIYYGYGRPNKKVRVDLWVFLALCPIFSALQWMCNKEMSLESSKKGR